MYVKVTTSGPRKYVKLIGAYRDNKGKPKHRIDANLGRLEMVEAAGAHSLINGLLHASGNLSLEKGTGKIDFISVRSIGGTWLLSSLWKGLWFAEGAQRILRSKRTFAVFNLVWMRNFGKHWRIKLKAYFNSLLGFKPPY